MHLNDKNFKEMNVYDIYSSVGAAQLNNYKKFNVVIKKSLPAKLKSY